MNGLLEGRSIVNTRSVGQAAELDRLLIQHGALPLSFPCIAIEPPDDTTPLDEALINLSGAEFTWLVFTSANSVEAVAGRLAALDLPVAIPPAVRVAVIGSATARSFAASFGRRHDFIPERANAEALASTLPVLEGDRVLLPGSDIARPELPRILRERGAGVTTVMAYRTVVGRGGVELGVLLRIGVVDAVLFASPSAVEGCLIRLEARGGGVADLAEIPIVCIGETTAAAARTHGLQVDVAAEETLEGLVERVTKLYAPVGSGGATW